MKGSNFLVGLLAVALAAAFGTVGAATWDVACADYTTMTNTVCTGGKLELDEFSPGQHFLTGSAETRVFDTTAPSFLDWVRGTATYNGLLDGLNKAINGDFEGGTYGPGVPNDWVVSDTTNMEEEGVTGTYLTSDASEGSFAFYLDPKDDDPDPTDDDFGRNIFPYMYGGNPAWDITPGQTLHLLFDLKHESDGAPMQLKIRLDGDNIPDTGSSVWATYERATDGYEEEYFAVDPTMFGENPQWDEMYLQFGFDFHNNDVDHRVLIDNLRVYQIDGGSYFPVKVKVRSGPCDFSLFPSCAGPWEDYDYLTVIPERVAPGATSNRYVQFRVELATTLGNMAVSPSLDSLALDYTPGVFEFEMKWDGPLADLFDWSPQPAGSLGPVRTDSEGNLYVNDFNPTPIRFWGIQVDDSIHKQLDGSNHPADVVAFCERLADLGFNMIKLLPPNPASASTDDWLDFDILVDECKQEGIYFMFRGEGGDCGGNAVRRFFDVPLPGGTSTWEKCEAHLEGILEHEYNGTAYKDDPGIAFIALINEDALHEGWRAEWNLPATEKGVLDYAWAEHLSLWHGNLTAMHYAWGCDLHPLTGAPVADPVCYLPEEIPNDTLPTSFLQMKMMPFPDSSFRPYRRAIDSSSLLGSQMTDYYQHFADFLNGVGPDSIAGGVEAQITGVQHWYGLSDLQARTNVNGMEVIGTHSYFDNIGSRYVFESGEVVLQHPQSLSPHINMISHTALSAVTDKPLIVTESNVETPNLYSKAELPLVVSSYFGFHDWDAYTLFLHSTRDHYGPNASGKKIPWKHESIFDPSLMAQMPAASRIYRKGMVQPGAIGNAIQLEHAFDGFAVEYDETNEFHINKRDLHFQVTPTSTTALTNDWSLVHRIERKEFWGMTRRDAEDYVTGSPSTPYVTDTGELELDPDQGQFLLDAESAKGFAGFTSAPPVDLGDLQVTLVPWFNEYAAVSLVALDDAPIADSTDLLVTATSRWENTGWNWRADKRGLSNPEGHSNEAHWGDTPVLVQGVFGILALTTNNEQPEVCPLDNEGNEITAECWEPSGFGGTYYIVISPDHETLWYRVTLEEKKT